MKMFFEDKEAFIKKILQMQNSFFDERIRSKESRIQELEGDIQNKKNLGMIEEAEAKFLKDTNTSEQEFQKIMEFVESDLPPRVSKELEKLEPYEFFIKAKELYEAQKPKEKSPPLHLSGGAGSSGVGGDESPMNRI